MQMRWMLVLLVVACGGVKSDPAADDWSGALTAFADARCQWNFDCNDSKKADCADTTVQIMDDGMATLDARACIACMQAWTEVYADIAAGACATVLTSAQAQAIHAACDTGPDYDGFEVCATEDLPGSDPIGGSGVR